MPLFCFIIPTWIPWHFWGERSMYAWYLTLFRYTLSLNLTWLVNSAAHMWGMKPYDRYIEIFFSFLKSAGPFAFVNITNKKIFY